MQIDIPIKLALLVAKTYLFWTVLTPPNAAPRAQERRAGSQSEIIMRLTIGWGPLFVKLIFALEAAVEATCVLASAYPSSLSSHALTFFIGSPSVHPRLFALSPSFTFAHLLAISGGLLRLWAFRALGRHFTFELAVLKDHALVTSGPYARVRHPSYTGLVGLMWGAALALGARGSWSREVLMPRLWAGSGVGAWAARVFGAGMLALQWAVIAALVGRTRAEDAFLRERFGKEWDAWASSVRWRLVPGLF